jgi:predicted lipoprotein
VRRRGLNLALLLLALPRCQAGVDRRAVLAQLVRDVILPQQAQLVATAVALGAAARGLAVDPAALGATQGSWREALLALERTYAATAGPLGNLGFRLRAAYWPVRPAAIEALDATAAEIDRAGAAVKGLFAIEYLLFDPASARGLADLARRQLLARLCSNYERVCRAAASDAQTPERRANLLADVQAALGLVVNGLVEAVETARAVTATQDRPALTAGARSNSRALIARARIEGAHDLYRPLGPLVAAVAPAIDADLQRAFAAALAAPGAGHALEIALKSGLPGALGVALTTRSADGD